MKDILKRLPSEVAQRVHPDWKRNERSYWARREDLRREYEGQWIAFADDAVIASGSSPVQVLHAAQRTGRHPFITCVGREDTPQRMRRSVYSYDLAYPGEPLPRVPVNFRSAAGAPGLTFEDTRGGRSEVGHAAEQAAATDERREHGRVIRTYGGAARG